MQTRIKTERKLIYEKFPHEILRDIFSLFNFRTLITIRRVCTNWNEWIKESFEKESFCKRVELGNGIFGWENIMNHFSSRQRKYKRENPKLYEIKVEESMSHYHIERDISSCFILFCPGLKSRKDRLIVFYPKKGYFEKITLSGKIIDKKYTKNGNLFILTRRNESLTVHRFCYYEKIIYKKVTLDFSSLLDFSIFILTDAVIFVEIEKLDGEEDKSDSIFSIANSEWKKENDPKVVSHKKIFQYPIVDCVGNKIYLYNTKDENLSCYRYESEKITFEKNYPIEGFKIDEFYMGNFNGKTYCYSHRRDRRNQKVIFHCLDNNDHFEKPLEIKNIYSKSFKPTKNKPFDRNLDIVIPELNGAHCRSNEFESDGLLVQRDLNGWELYQSSGDYLFFWFKPLKSEINNNTENEIDGENNTDSENEIDNNDDNNDNNSQSENNSNDKNDDKTDTHEGEDNGNDENDQIAYKIDIDQGENENNNSESDSDSNSNSNEAKEKNSVETTIDKNNSNRKVKELDLSEKSHDEPLIEKCFASDYDNSLCFDGKTGEYYVDPFGDEKIILILKNKYGWLDYWLYGNAIFCRKSKLDKREAIIIYDYFT